MDAQDMQTQAQEERERDHNFAVAVLNSDKWGLHPRLQAFLDMCHKRITPEKWREIDDRYERKSETSQSLAPRA